MFSERPPIEKQSYQESWTEKLKTLEQPSINELVLVNELNVSISLAMQSPDGTLLLLTRRSLPTGQSISSITLFALHTDVNRFFFLNRTTNNETFFSAFVKLERFSASFCFRLSGRFLIITAILSALSGFVTALQSITNLLLKQYFWFTRWHTLRALDE